MIDKEIIVLTYCARSKTDLKFGTPEELYNSQRIKSFFKRFNTKKAILSYKYGLIGENEIIENYEQAEFGKNYPVLCAVVFNKLIRENCDVYFYSPREIVEKPWIKLLNDSGIDYKVIRSYKDLPQKKMKGVV